MIQNIKKPKLIFLFIIYVILTSILVWILKPIYFISLIIIIGIPTTLNFILLKHSKLKIILFSFLATLLFAPAIELMCRLANVWDVQTIFPRILEILPIENMIFAFFNFVWVLSFYEYFIDKNTKDKISNKLKYVVIMFSLLFVFTLVLFFYNSNIITLNYYEMAIIFLIIPAIILTFVEPKIIKKTVVPILFFSIIFFVYEFIAIQIGNWWWPAEYLLPINLFGHVFPIDDIIFWYILSTMTLILGYEFFVDDGK